MKRFTTYPYMSQSDLNQEYYDACCRGDLEQLQYVLHSPDLKLHADIYYDNGISFYWAYQEKIMNVINFLLYEENYQMTDEVKKEFTEIFTINSSLNYYENLVSLEDLNVLFEKRDVYFKLNDLSAKPPSKMKKI